MMIVKVSTPLNTSADLAWSTVKKIDTLRYVARGLLGFAGEGIPEEVRAGDSFRVRLLLFNILPAWTQEMHIVYVDDEKRELYSNERGGMVRTWNHRISIEPESEGRCRYTDEIEIDAGALTLFVCAYAHFFDRYRQMRWRRLARSLS